MTSKKARDTVSQAEEQHANILHTDHDSSPSDKAFLDYFTAIKETLIQKRGKPKDEKVRELLREYYTMVQGREEPVSEFAHRFLEIQHSLEKLIPNIHYTSDKKDTELQHAFFIKLRPHIAKHLASRDFDFKSVQSVIEIAERYDKQFGSPFPSGRTATYSDPFREDKAMLKLSSEHPNCYNCGKFGHFKKNCKTANGTVDRSNLNVTKKQPEIYNLYNRYSKPNCLIQSGGILKCKFNNLHKCSVCSHSSCALYKHNSNSNRQLNLLSSHDSSAIEQQITSSINQGFEKLEDKLAGLTSSTTDSTFNSRDSSENDNLPMFGMPSVVTDKVDLPNLSNRHIMWCKVKSGEGGIDISLPLDSCCSVSSCSLKHAKLMQEKYPSFKWVKLSSPVAVHVANKDAELQGVGMQDVHINWGPGKYSVHTMLVVPKLSFPALFGNNHLECCDAVVSHKERIVHDNAI